MIYFIENRLNNFHFLAGLLAASLVTFLAALASAQAPPQWTPWPLTRTVYLIQSQCPGQCYPIVKDGKLIDLEVALLINGELQEVQSKKDAKQAAKAAQDQAESDKKSKRDAAISLINNFDETKMKPADVAALIKAILVERGLK